MNVKNIINQASVLDDEMAWGLIEPELEKGYDAKLWHLASKIATRLNNYPFLSDFYKNVLIADPTNPTIYFKLLDSLLKAEYYNDFIGHLQEAQENNILSTELIEKIYARFAGQICKNFDNFSDETVLLLLDNILNLKITYDTDFTQKIFNNFIKNILSKDFNNKENVIFLNKSICLSNFVHFKILMNITANFLKQNIFTQAYHILNHIFSIDPFNAQGFMYAVMLVEKDENYNCFITQWLCFIEKNYKTENEMLNYALCLMYVQDYIKADIIFKNALIDFNDSEKIMFHYAENLFFLDRFDEAKIFIAAHEHKITTLKTKLFQLKAQIALAIYDVQALEAVLETARKEKIIAPYIIKIALALQKDEEAYRCYHNMALIQDLYDIFPNKQFPFAIFEKNNTKPIKAKMLVLNSILGLGDEIRFSSFLPTLSKICTDVRIVCDSRLYDLRTRQFPKISFIPLDRINQDLSQSPVKNKSFYAEFNHQIYAFAQDADYVVIFPQFLELLSKFEKKSLKNTEAKSFLSLVKKYFLNKTDNLKVKNLLTPRLDIQNYWQDWLNRLPKKPKIGLFWRSDATGLRYNHKKSNLADWIELLKDLQIVIVPLQYSVSKAEISLMQDYPDLFFMPPDLDLKNDIEGLSGLICALDYIVATAGTTQHIAGALNKTVLACVHPYELYWRCGIDVTKDRFDSNVQLLFSEPSQGIKGSMNVTVKKLKEILKEN